MARDSNPDIQMNKPFDYTLRVSRRVKHAKLQIKPYGGLEVVIPVRFPKKAVPGLIQQHAAWITQHLQKQKHQFPDPGLPDQIHLSFNGESTRVCYGDEQPANPGSCLKVAALQFDERIHQLRQWVRQQAWILLPPLLEQTAERTGLDYKKISVRSQKTRWGSCSTSGTISVNDQLVFVPFETAEYLMVHELCHTRFLNHSRKFWDLVEQHCPEFRRHERVLNQARHSVPDWFLKDLYQ